MEKRPKIALLSLYLLDLYMYENPGEPRPFPAYVHMSLPCLTTALQFTGHQ